MKKGWFLRLGHVGHGGQGGQPHLLADSGEVGFCDMPVGGDERGELRRRGPCVAKLAFGDTILKLFVPMDL
jgi:hypothetical protein